MRHVGPTSYIYIYIYIYIIREEQKFLVGITFFFSLASLFDIRKSDHRNSSGQEEKCSTR